ncbi:20326_t:CDS:2 [Rhizophagus irregularis]|nr:20326_t:CDS:2 [Rhizophagus irregularis]
MVITLEPFETITRKISGAKYSTLSLVVPYIYILKNNFAPNEENETLEMYLNLVYGSNGEEEDSEMVSDDEYIPSASTSHPVEPNLDDINIVEYLQSVNTEGLLQKVRVAIYLSLDELWPVPSNIMLVATFLDPRFKNFDWCNGNDKDEAKELVQVLYNDAKKDISPRDSINSIITSSSDDDDDIFKALKD